MRGVEGGEERERRVGRGEEEPMDLHSARQDR